MDAVESRLSEDLSNVLGRFSQHWEAAAVEDRKIREAAAFEDSARIRRASDDDLAVQRIILSQVESDFWG